MEVRVKKQNQTKQTKKNENIYFHPSSGRHCCLCQIFDTEIDYSQLPDNSNYEFELSRVRSK